MSGSTRTIVYVDGFNLYHGLVQSSGEANIWLNLQTLCTTPLFLGRDSQSKVPYPTSTLAKVRYFSARAPRVESAARQSVYWAALKANCPLVEIHEGRYQTRMVTCRECGNSYPKHEEKLTDVNLATSVVADATQGRMTRAVILSGDADLSPAFRHLEKLTPEITRVIVRPPKRRSNELDSTAHFALQLYPKDVAKHQLPHSTQTSRTIRIQRPETWRG